MQVTYVQVFCFWCEKQQRLSANLRPKAAPAGGGLRRKRAHGTRTNSASSITIVMVVVIVDVVAAVILRASVTTIDAPPAGSKRSDIQTESQDGPHANQLSSLNALPVHLLSRF